MGWKGERREAGVKVNQLRPAKEEVRFPVDVITGGNSRRSKKLRFIENVLQEEAERYGSPTTICKKKSKKQSVTIRQEQSAKSLESGRLA